MLACRSLYTGMLIRTTVLFSGCPKQFSVTAPAKPPTFKDSTYSSSKFKVDQAAYDANLTGADDADTAKHLRDKIVYGLMGDIDDAYGQFTKNLYTGKGAFAVGADSTQLGLTAAATIATHTPTKTIMSALATAFTGVNLSIDKNFFAQQTYQTIAVAMQTRRDKARKAISDNLNDDDEDYPLEAAKRDLVAYFYSGTLQVVFKNCKKRLALLRKRTRPTPKQLSIRSYAFVVVPIHYPSEPAWLQILGSHLQSF